MAQTIEQTPSEEIHVHSVVSAHLLWDEMAPQVGLQNCFVASHMQFADAEQVAKFVFLLQASTQLLLVIMHSFGLQLETVCALQAAVQLPLAPSHWHDDDATQALCLSPYFSWQLVVHPVEVNTQAETDVQVAAVRTSQSNTQLENRLTTQPALVGHEVADDSPHEVEQVPVPALYVQSGFAVHDAPVELLMVEHLVLHCRVLVFQLQRGSAEQEALDGYLARHFRTQTPAFISHSA